MPDVINFKNCYLVENCMQVWLYFCIECLNKLGGVVFFNLLCHSQMKSTCT